MKFARFRQPALSALAILLISGAGVAFAGTSRSGAPAAAAPAVAAPAVVRAVAPVANPAAQPAPAAEPKQPAGADTDTLQQGDQAAPDTTSESASEAAGSGTEKAGAEEPGDANLPGGGHADNPNDPNADHQFQGVE
jgi:hypothetical protein